MTNVLPAILFGGPPHAGKSVLFYSITMALRNRGIAHYAIRACPDGEGNWSQEIDQSTVRLIRIKGAWSPTFVEGVCRDLEQRSLPLLVDMGGRPETTQFCILRNCTHSLLLLKHDEQALSRRWQQLVTDHGLLPLAQLYSERDGLSSLSASEPVIEGAITGLKRGLVAEGSVFDALVERIATLFAYPPAELEHLHFAMAPTELVVDLRTFIRKIDPHASKWTPEMLPVLLDDVPSDISLSVYGIAPHWLYGALAIHAGQQPFYQFSRIGWVKPPELVISEGSSSEVACLIREYERFNVLDITIASKHLDYLQADHLPFPPVARDKGIILYGSMPAWLLTALVRLYRDIGVAWIACYQLQLDQAVVVADRTGNYKPGDQIAMPVLNT